MAAGVKMGVQAQDGAISYPVSVRGQWTVAHRDLSATAETSTVLLNPGTYAGTNVVPVELPSCTRLLMRLRTKLITGVTTSPVVCIYGGWGPAASYTQSTGVFLTDGSITWSRLDNPAAGSTGVTLTPTTAGYRDTTYRYSDIYDITGTDLLGAQYLLALTQTAGVVTGGTDQAIELLVMAIN